MSKELKHHGIKGQKWGVRRFQNEDGSLTPAGRARQRGEYEPDTSHDDYKRAHSGKKVNEMSDKELRETNNRLNMEKQYNQMTAKQMSPGKKFVTGVVVAVGTQLATEYVRKYAKAGIENAPELIGRAAANGVIRKGASLAWKQ